MENALYEIESIRRLAGFASVTEALPDETTIPNFRHLLEKQQLTQHQHVIYVFIHIVYSIRIFIIIHQLNA